MTREIKFRAWDTCTKEMLFDVLVHKSFCSVPDDYNGKAWILTPAMKRWEIMQYTGLKDKAGREIYEGDIVQYSNILGRPKPENIKIDYVTWFQGRSHFCLSKEELWALNCWEGPYLEIIGNVHENPELLEVK